MKITQLNPNDKIMVINAGSSSIKFQLFCFQNNDVRTFWKGAVQGIRTKVGTFQHHFLKNSFNSHIIFNNHQEAVNHILQTMLDNNIVGALSDIKIVGHRVVHGGVYFIKPIIINHQVLATLESIKDLAPLHIPAHLAAIKTFMQKTTAINVAVFDTAFHNTIPKINYLFPVPWSWYQKHSVRKYGFHGISCEYLVKRVAQLLNQKTETMNGIICHLGNGASITAIKNNRSFDTSMGLTPLAGLMMGTRSGDVDPSLFQYIHQKEKISIQKITDVLNYESGFLAISNISSDLQEIETAHKKGNKQATLAIDMFVKRVVNYIVIYFNALNGNVDYLLFAGGIGENSSLIIKKILAKLKIFSSISHCQIPNKSMWKHDSDHFFISLDKPKILLMKTNEEIMICQSAISLVLGKLK